MKELRLQTSVLPLKAHERQAAREQPKPSSGRQTSFCASPAFPRNVCDLPRSPGHGALKGGIVPAAGSAGEDQCWEGACRVAGRDVCRAAQTGTAATRLQRLVCGHGGDEKPPAVGEGRAVPSPGQGAHTALPPEPPADEAVPTAPTQNHSPSPSNPASSQTQPAPAPTLAKALCSFLGPQIIPWTRGKLLEMV